MRPFLSHLIHSRPGRAMAWLAWLVLVASPVHGGPSALLGGSAHGGHVVSLVSDVGHAGQHAAVDTSDQCCMDMHPDGHVDPGVCQCASLCASTLPAVAALIPGRMAASDPPASPGPVSAPPGAHVRLLRPPAA